MGNYFVFDKNKLINLGIAFRSELELERFTNAINDAVEEQVICDFLESLPDEKRQEFERIERSMSAEERAKWIDMNCSEINKIVERVCIESKCNLIRTRDRIPGLVHSMENDWKGTRITLLDDMSMGEYKKLRGHCIDTMGELERLKISDLMKVLECSEKDAIAFEKMFQYYKELFMNEYVEVLRDV